MNNKVITKGIFMKNSPHRAKHQVEKAVRQANKAHQAPQNNSAASKQAEIAKVHNQIRRYEDHLKLENSKTSLQVLNIFKKYLERARYRDKPHQSRRTSKGVITDEGPVNQFHPHIGYGDHSKNLSGMEKSRDIGRKHLKNQDYRKAA